MAIDLTKKSNRTLQSRRYTLDTLTDGQEAFTQVFDLGSGEIYTQTNYIPTSSLPFSGSTQDGYYYTTGSTISSTSTGNDVLRYWYRHKLTKGQTAIVGDEAWFFISGSSLTSVGEQLIATNQQTNFISPKYSIPALSTNTTEAATPGYKIVAYYSNNGASFSEIDSSFYNFDYKTGIFQFTSSVIANTTIADQTNGRVYLSAYQYVGETLDERINLIESRIGTGGNGTGAGFPFSGSAVITGSLAVSGSNVNFTLATGVSGAFSGSFSGDGSGLTNLSNVVYTNLADNAVQNIGGTLKLTGDIVAENFVVSSSVYYYTESFASGSNKFGDSGDDTHQFTGSLQVSGALKLNIATDSIGERTPLVIDGNGNVYIANADYITAADADVYELKISSSGDNNLITITNSEALIISGAGGLSVTSNTNTLTIRAGGGILSSSAQIATEISGAFTSTSSSLASRITTNASDISLLQSSASAGFVISSSGGQFSIGSYQTASFTGGTAGISVVSDIGTKKITIGASTDNVTFNTLKLDNVPAIGDSAIRPILILSSSDMISQDVGLSYNSTPSIHQLFISGGISLDQLILGSSTNNVGLSNITATNLGALTFPSKNAFFIGRDATDYHIYLSGSSNSKTTQITGSLFINSLTNTNSSNVLVYNTTTGQVTYDTTYNSSITSLNNATSSYLLSSQTGSGFESLVVKGDLIVNGTATYINVDNLAIEDKFILLNSGSLGSPTAEGGIIVQTTSGGSGSAFYYDPDANRWALTRSGSVAGNAASITLGATTEFVVTISSSNAGPSSIPTNFGATDTYRAGQMHINTNTGDIWIYS
jgi:hypothetical protein